VHGAEYRKYQRVVAAAHLDGLFRARPLAISFYMQESDPDLNFKKNNLHEYVQERSPSRAAGS